MSCPGISWPCDSRTFLSGWLATGPGSGRCRNRNTQPACGSFHPVRKGSGGLEGEGRKVGVHRKGCRRKPGKVGPGARQGPRVCASEGDLIASPATLRGWYRGK